MLTTSLVQVLCGKKKKKELLCLLIDFKRPFKGLKVFILPQSSNIVSFFRLIFVGGSDQSTYCHLLTFLHMGVLPSTHLPSLLPEVVAEACIRAGSWARSGYKQNTAQLLSHPSHCYGIRILHVLWKQGFLLSKIIIPHTFNQHWSPQTVQIKFSSTSACTGGATATTTRDKTNEGEGPKWLQTKQSKSIF